MSRGVQQLLISLAAGVVVGLIRISYCLFPGHALTDVILFALAGAWIAYRWPARWWLWTAALLIPTILQIGFGPALRAQETGVEAGIGFAFSAILVAGGAFGAGAAMAWGRRRREALAGR